jgi:dTDP-3-amino-3,4,6-trideoxy-alpha-D-glucose transaminase
LRAGSTDNEGRIPSPILMNDFRRQWAETGDDVLAAVTAVGASGWYVLGERVKSFESGLASFWGIGEAVGVASGLDAIEIALRAAGMRPGDKVLTTPLSAFATTLAIVRAGGVPVFCDTDARGLIDLDEARQALRAFPEIRYFVPVHLYGFPLDGVRLRALIDEFGLACIEDCAQSIGAADSGRSGIAAATSFYPTKNLGAMGDGGAVLTDDAAFAARVRRLRDYGQSAKYVHAEIGWNSRLDELQAAILERAYLPRLARWTERRRFLAGLYRARWSSDRVRPFAAVEGACWHLFPVRVSGGGKPGLMGWLRGQGIGTGEHYPFVIPDQPAMKDLPFVSFGDLARAREIAATELSLPIHPYMDDGEVERVIAAVKAWPG